MTLARSRYFLSLVIPNSELMTREFLREIADGLDSRYVNFEIIVVDYGYQAANKHYFDSIRDDVPNIRRLQISNCSSQEYACLAALQYVLGEITVIGDLTRDSYEDITSIADACEANKICQVGTSIPKNFIQKSLRKLLYRVSKIIFNVPSLEFSTGLLALPREDVTQVNKNHLSNLNLKTDIPRLQIPYTRFNYQIEKKEQDSTDYFVKIEQTLRALILNSSRPLRFASGIALVTSLANISYVFYVILVYVFRKNVVEGWVTTNLLVCCNFIFLSFAAAIGFEYLLRVLRENAKKFDHIKVNEDCSRSMISAELSRRNVVSDCLDSEDGLLQ